MYWNDDPGQQGICQEADDICHSDSVLYPIARKVRRGNAALDDYTFLAMTADGTWTFDDSNLGTLPIAVADIVSGQFDYSFQSDFFELQQVLVADVNGNWNELVPFNINQNQSRPFWEQWPSTGGIPSNYDKVGNSILLYATPNYNRTGGLKLVLKRKMRQFSVSDTLIVPGIPSLHHMWLARKVALPYLVEHPSNSTNFNTVEGLIAADDAKIQEFYAKRSADEGSTLKPKWSSSR